MHLLDNASLYSGMNANAAYLHSILGVQVNQTGYSATDNGTLCLTRTHIIYLSYRPYATHTHTHTHLPEQTQTHHRFWLPHARIEPLT